MLRTRSKPIPVDTVKPGMYGKWFFDITEGDTIINVRVINPNIDMEEFVKRFLASPRNRWMRDFLV